MGLRKRLRDIRRSIARQPSSLDADDGPEPSPTPTSHSDKTPTPTPSPTATPTRSPTPTPTATSTPVTSGADKVVVIMEENHTQAQAQAGMPYLMSLQSTFGVTTAHTAPDPPVATQLSGDLRREHIRSDR